MTAQGIKTWHIVIAGATQSDGEFNGSLRLWLEMGHLRNAETCVSLHEWDSDWGELANKIDLANHNGDRPDVRIYAYSWGAGHGAITLAKELQARGITVKTLCACDPVYHSWLWSLRWLAMVRGPVIRVPANVREVCGVFQTTNKPAGHRMVAVDPTATRVRLFLELHGVEHHWMDDQPAWHDLCLGVAKG
ncbi:MAG TPA: hypothetical protein VM487_19930 [Phycisphaerae bacterium]|nr:hypothetical protein [Phycisphaerae bacterium]